MSFEPRDYLRHILVEADYLVEQSRNLTPNQFQGDATLQRAFVRSLEVIGEATKQLPEALRMKHPEVEWRSMARMRDRLIHGYFGVDYALVWDVVQQRIPPFQQAVRRMLESSPALYPEAEID
jgi:uncharacterized protein with HEPN domain